MGRMPLPVAPPDRLAAGPFDLRVMVEADWALEVALSMDPDVLRWTHYRPQMTEETASEAVALRTGYSFQRRATAIHQGAPTETTVWERMI